jgi:uncharacterized pyridoxamine 5'-phosphate oxidase family protein
LWAQNKSFDTQPVKMFGNNKFESAQTQLCAMYFLKLNKIYFEEQNDKQLYVTCVKRYGVSVSQMTSDIFNLS